MDLSIFFILFIASLILFLTLRYFIPSQSYYILNICYLIGILIFQFFLNIEVSKHVCGFYDITNVIVVTIVPWLVIMGSMFAFLKFFPNWLNPFANTFGTLLTTIPTNMYALFDNKQLLGKKNIINDFINNNDLSNVEKFVKDNNITYTIEGSSDSIDLVPYLKKIISTKLEISTFIWYGLCCVLILGIGISNIFTGSCNTSVKEMKKRNNQLKQKLNK